MKKILFLLLFLTGLTPVFKNNTLNLVCYQSYGQEPSNGEEDVVVCNSHVTTTSWQEGDWFITESCHLENGEKPWDDCVEVCDQDAEYSPVEPDPDDGDDGDDGSGGSGGSGGTGGTGGGGTTTPIKVGEAPITKTEFDRRKAYDYASYNPSVKENQVLTQSFGDAKVIGTLIRFENAFGHVFYYFTPYATAYGLTTGMYYRIPDRTDSSSPTYTYHFNNDVTGFPESGTSTIGDLFDLFGKPMTVTIEPNNSPITTTNNVPLTMKTWYLDKDGDGYHSDTRQATSNPGSGWKATTKGSDCNDNSYYKNIDCRPNWYLDMDVDGYDGGTQQSDTSPGTGWIKGTSLGTDCNDNVYNIQNICGNSRDCIENNTNNQTNIKPSQATLSQNAINLLKGIETLSLIPYNDKTGNPTTKYVDGATIGYGHLIANAAEFETYKNGISLSSANTLFTNDIDREIKAVRTLSYDLSQNQFDALAILVFNIGSTQFKSSSLRKFLQDCNAPTNYNSVENAWKAFNKDNGVIVQGLINRRNCEWDIFVNGIYKQW